MKTGWTTPAAWILVFLLVVALMILFQRPSSKVDLAQRSYSQLVGMGPNLKSALIRGDELDGRDETGERFAVRLPRDMAFADRLAKSGTDVVIGEASSDTAWLTTLLTNGVPLLLYGVAWVYPLLRIARALEGLLASRAPAPRTDAMDAAPPSA